MTKEIDRRDFSANKVTTSRENELKSLAEEASERLPDDEEVKIEKFDATTGNPAVIALESAPLKKGNYIQRALEQVQELGNVLGLEKSQPAEFVPDPNVQKTSSNAKTVHLRQQYKGIDIFQAATTVRFAIDDRLEEMAGNTITISKDIAVSPKLSVQEAVLKAVQYLTTVDDETEQQPETDQFGEPLKVITLDLSTFEPKVIATFVNQPAIPTVLEAGPFGDEIIANLIWFPLTDDKMRLTWETIITMPGYLDQYRAIVDAENGEVLYCKQLIQQLLGRGNVFERDGASGRRLVDFPRRLEDYFAQIPNNLPAQFPDPWVENDTTVGNCVKAHLGDFGPPARGMRQDNNNIIIFDPAEPEGDDQKVVNIFYYNCYLHDLFYLLGFREEDGNFQSNNYGRGGTANDAVDARAHSGPVNGTANMATPPDGLGAIMNMGLVSHTNRHTALDESVVCHELCHGVSNRLVGGRFDTRSLDSPQSGGMGEGWGDYFACTVLETDVVGRWVTDNITGIRAHPYDSNFPDNFGNLGSGRYRIVYRNSRRIVPVHAIGEIWCATLIEMNKKIGEGLGNERRGKTLAMQLVVDALKLSPTNPSFLNMRDSILKALEDKLRDHQLSSDEYELVWRNVWEAFAKFGMGPAAQSNRAQLSGIVADFNVPRSRT